MSQLSGVAARQAKQFSKPGAQALRLLGLALPDHRHPPPRRLQRGPVLRIAAGVALELGQPVVLPALGVGRELAAVPVPEAAMHEDHRAVLRKDQVRPAGQALAMQAEAQPKPVRGRAHQHLGLGVLALDARHEAAARLWADRVHLERG